MDRCSFGKTFNNWRDITIDDNSDNVNADDGDNDNDDDDDDVYF